MAYLDSQLSYPSVETDEFMELQPYEILVREVCLIFNFLSIVCLLIDNCLKEQTDVIELTAIANNFVYHGQTIPDSVLVRTIQMVIVIKLSLFLKMEPDLLD